ncbi:MAG TPA: methylated-DNA--[protein]-cysteine S-methyltransferase [Thermoanaerobaculia bacterium]|jgi:methylated-DNA-[protein]-cysteine S-methyltransferase|nr:methylated-DNA--[protein]-cysteine S-methyltransferase [Thermoanaerobaculia bacterium]
MPVFESPVGPLTIRVNDDGALEEIRFGAPGIRHPASEEQSRMPDAGCRIVIEQLNEYFAGTRREFDLPLAPRGTAFQLACWNELQRIAYGTTISYSELARRIAKPNAVRAVGAANGANPIPIIIPCHRVIGANGTLTGYGGGLHIKRALLALEQPQRTLLETA